MIIEPFFKLISRGNSLIFTYADIRQRIDPRMGSPEDKTMRKGKKFSASSLLTIIGVVCFASILVSAAIIVVDSISFNQGVINYPLIDLTRTDTVGVNAHADTVTTYTYTADPNQDVTNAVLHIWINKTSYATGDILSDTITVNWGGSPLAGTLSYDTNGVYYVSGTIATIPSAGVNGDAALTYHTTGSYTVLIRVIGSASA